MSARIMAAELKSSSEVDWARLERAAFVEHPTIVEESGGRARNESKLGFVLTIIAGIPLALIYLACYTAPIWGYAAVYDGMIASAAAPPDYETAVPVTGIFFMIAAVLLVVSTIHWLVTGRRRNGFYQIQAGLALVLGAAAGFAVFSNGIRENVTDWQLWIIPVVVAAGLGALFLILHLLASRKRKAQALKGSESVIENSLSLRDVMQQRKRRKRVAALSEEQQRRIRHDLTASFDDLERRGLITSAQSRYVRGIELGALALRAPSPIDYP